MNSGKDRAVSVAKPHAAARVRESRIEFHTVAVGTTFFNERNRHSIHVGRRLGDACLERFQVSVLLSGDGRLCEDDRVARAVLDRSHRAFELVPAPSNAAAQGIPANTNRGLL